MADTSAITGIVLAAGAGSRAGGPKALRRTPDGTPWTELAATTLLTAGCARVVVVLGARAVEARELVPVDDRITTVVAMEWERGMAESLRTGLAAVDGSAAVTLVDLPELPEAVVRRVLAVGGLARAVFDGRPGHPVLIPAEHRLAVAESLEGDRGARAYLVAHGVVEVECGDLWDGVDRDRG